MTNEERKEFINSRILNAIFDSIAVKPLDDITADEIAASAEISKRTLYKYYSSIQQKGDVSGYCKKLLYGTCAKNRRRNKKGNIR